MACPVCGGPVRSDNKSGFCRKHYGFKDHGIGPRPACRVCGTVLRFDNRTVYCHRHQHHRYLVGRRPSYPLCKTCGRELRIDNKSGYCNVHRRFMERTPRAPYPRKSKRTRQPKIGQDCRVLGCVKYRLEGVILCQEHLDAWKASDARRVAIRAASRWLDGVTSVPTGQRYSQRALEQMANQLLGSDFDKLPPSDALLTAVHIEDSIPLKNAVLGVKERYE